MALSPSSSDALAAQIRGMLGRAFTGIDGRAPTVRALAARFGVSFRTVIGALGILCERGELVRLPGRKGYFVSGAAGANRHVARSPQQLRRADEIYQTLRGELLQGQIEPQYGGLSIKALCHRFRAGRGTVTRSLSALLKDGLIGKQGRRYGKTRAGAGRTTPVYLYVGSRHQVAFHNSPQFAFVTSAEREMKRLGWGTPSMVSAADPMRDLPELWDKGHFLYLRPPFLRMIQNKLAHWKRHTLILVDPASELSGVSLRRFRNVYCIQPDQTGAGKDVGDYCLRRNCRRIAFLAEGTGEGLPVWASNRLDGLRGACAAHSSSASEVVLCCAQDCAAAHSTTSAREVQSVLEECLKTQWKWAHRIRTLPPELPHALVSSGFSSVHELISFRKLMIGMAPAFDHALSDPDLTAWVCGNDPVAVAACLHLTWRGVPKARWPLLCGFDNSPMSYILGFTSYDFCWDRMGVLAIQCIGTPSNFPGGPDHVYRLPGELISRHAKPFRPSGM